MQRLTLLILLLSFLKVNAQTFTLKSNVLGGQAENIQFAKSFGCTGGNKSPELSWENAPGETKSFAVTMFDEDAPTGSGWWHWIMFDIDKNVSELKNEAGNPDSNLAPVHSVQSITDNGTKGYGGPCPPIGDKPHRYIITLYSLRVEKLGLPDTANPALVGFYLNQNTIAKASLVIYAKR